jgi:hypothetical protein
MEENWNAKNLQRSHASELRRLDPLVGAWQAKDRTQDSIFGPGVPVTSMEEFSWFEGGFFLVQTYDTTFGE